MLHYSAGITFNCLYSIKDPTAIGSSSYGFGLKVIGWNILYNMGYMYNDGAKIQGYMKSSNTVDNWENVGYRTGDFIMRFFWSRYVPRSYK